MTAWLTAAFSQALATDGLWFLVVGVIAAGLVRGFSGFGTAMIFMPFAATTLSPVWALTALIVFDLFGPLPILPRALRDGQPRDVLRLGLGAMVTLPIGLYLLTRIDPASFRWLVSVVSITLLVLLVSGWRYQGVLSRKMTYSVGAMGGLLGGISGLAGPPVIMLYMSSRHKIETIRANILMYLLVVEFLAIFMFAWSGLLAATPVLIGALLVIPYMAANVIGATLFRPEREKIYRLLAYVLIAGSAVSNLPLFD